MFLFGGFVGVLNNTVKLVKVNFYYLKANVNKKGIYIWSNKTRRLIRHSIVPYLIVIDTVRSSAFGLRGRIRSDRCFDRWWQ